MQPFELSEIQRQVLQALRTRIEPRRIHRIWIFPAHQVKARETGLFVLALRPEAEDRDDLFPLHTLRYQAASEKGKLSVEQSVAEEGRTTADRIDRVIAGVLSRAGAEVGEPIEEEISGSEEAWDELLERLGVRVDPVSQ